MKKAQVIHVVDWEARSRADQSRKALAIGWHAEVYGGLDELLRFAPPGGLVLMRDGLEELTIAQLSGRLVKHGIWLPLIATARKARVERIVAAIKAGALDYLTLPLARAQLAEALDRTRDEAAEQAEARRSMIEARDRIGALSGREREVLEWLVEGSSNKAIARALKISPRTVEIHRANMMGKLGATHAAEAVRLRLEAKL